MKKIIIKVICSFLLIVAVTGLVANRADAQTMQILGQFPGQFQGQFPGGYAGGNQNYQADTSQPTDSKNLPEFNNAKGWWASYPGGWYSGPRWNYWNNYPSVTNCPGAEEKTGDIEKKTGDIEEKTK